jgi:hypothetical protein
MKKSRSLAGLLALACTWLAAALVRAQDAPEARARSLFEKGIAELQAGQFESGCAALDESQGLQPNLGTLIASADCFERWGKAHSAALRYERFLEQVALLDESERAHREAQLEFVREALARSRDAIPELLLVPPQPTPTQLEVWLDQRLIELNGTEQRLALDPGAYRLETRAPGRLPWLLELTLVARERRRVELSTGATVIPEAPPMQPPQPNPPAPDRPAAASPTPWRSVGWGLGGLGLAGFGVAAVAGGLVLDTCPSFKCRSDRAESDATTLALVADIGIGVGVAGLVASAILLLENPADPVSSAGFEPVVALNRKSLVIGVAQPW